MSPRSVLFAAGCAVFLASPARAGAGNADFVWFGGPILAGGDLRPEAIAVKDGRVVALGTRAEVERAWKGARTLPIDLYGRALVPGLVAGSPSAEPPGPRGRANLKVAAAHAAAPPAPAPTPIPKRTPVPVPTPAARAAARRPAPTPVPRTEAPPLLALAADVSPPPDALPYTIASVRDALRAWMLRSRLPARHRLVLGVGYDDAKIAEKRLPTREELDTVSAKMPVLVVSRTGDAGAYNTVALQKAGVSWRSKDPPGGVIRRRGRIGEPSGVLEGAAHAAAFARVVPHIDGKERARLLADSERLSAPEEPTPAAVVAAAAPAGPAAGPVVPAPVETAPPPLPVPTPAPPLAAPPAAPAVAAAPLPIPPGSRDAGSPAVARLVADVLEGRATLAPGSAADLSVLSADPATTDAAQREKLRIVEEVRKGRTVWRRDRG